MVKMEEENKRLRSQLLEANDKTEADADLHQTEIDTLRSKFIQTERHYQNNVHTLETELTEMSKEITNLKLTRLSTSRKSEPEADAQLRRLEEKVKQKDQQIEALMKEINRLEETSGKLKTKNENLARENAKIPSLKKMNDELHEETKTLKLELRRTGSQLETASLAVKEEKQLRKQKEIEQGLRLEQKLLELESVRFELSTLKGIYAELQAELEKRKNSFQAVIESKGKLNEEIQRQQQQLLELEAQNQEQEEKLRRRELELKKKEQEIMLLETEREGLSQLGSTFNEKSKTENIFRAQVGKLIKDNQSLRAQHQKLQQAHFAIEKERTELQGTLASSRNTIASLNSAKEELALKHKDMESVARKYHSLNERAFHLYGMSLNDLVSQNYLGSRLKKREERVSLLADEVEELKSLHQRKSKDYEDIMTANYQLQLKVEESRRAEREAEGYKEMCRKLESEKKEALWREQEMRKQLNKFMRMEEEDFERYERTLRRH